MKTFRQLKFGANGIKALTKTTIIYIFVDEAWTGLMVVSFLRRTDKLGRRTTFSRSRHSVGSENICRKRAPGSQMSSRRSL